MPALIWCPLSDSNRPPTAYKTVALPDELKGRKYLNTCMTSKDSKQLVETLLATYNNISKFSSSAAQLAYERGILTGLLSSLIYNDTYAATAIKKLISDRSQR